MDTARLSKIPLDESSDLVNEAIRAAEYVAELEGKAMSRAENFIIRLTGGVPQSMEAATEWVAKGPTGLRKIFNPLNWFRLTPQSRAQEALERISTNVQSVIGIYNPNLGVDDTIQLMRAVIKGGTENPQVAHIVATAQGRAVQSWLKGAGGVVDDLEQFWLKSARQRGVVDAMGRLLSNASQGEDDLHTVMSKLLYGEQDDLWQELTRILDAAPTENMQVYHELLNTLRAEGSLHQDFLKGLGRMFKDQPFDADTFKLHMLGNLRPEGIGLVDKGHEYAQGRRVSYLPARQRQLSHYQLPEQRSYGHCPRCLQHDEVR
jgi:hypothetical protein